MTPDSISFEQRRLEVRTTVFGKEAWGIVKISIHSYIVNKMMSISSSEHGWAAEIKIAATI